MSFRRKTDDGDVPGRGFGSQERRDSFPPEGKAGKYAASKRAGRIRAPGDLEYNDTADESTEKDRYLITYADLITLLLGFFIILYSISNVDLSKYETMVFAMGDIFGGSAGKFVGMESNGEGMPSQIDLLKNELNQLIEEYNYSSSVKLEENERGITVRILEDILFPSGSAELTSSSRLVLHQVANILKKLPNDIRVEGHTDDVPIASNSYPSNWHLSVNRALNTAYYLIKYETLPPDRVSIVGYSEYKPVSANKTPSGRSANRRVDIVIIKN